MRIYNFYVPSVGPALCARGVLLRGGAPLLLRGTALSPPYLAERLDDTVSRRTARLEHIVNHLRLARGKPAASLAKRLMLPFSNDTLLRSCGDDSVRRGDDHGSPKAMQDLVDNASAAFVSTIGWVGSRRGLRFDEMPIC